MLATIVKAAFEGNKQFQIAFDKVFLLCAPGIVTRKSRKKPSKHVEVPMMTKSIKW